MYRLFNFPQFSHPDKYKTVISKITELLMETKGVISVYQIGSIGDPGISDIDLVAVFEENSSINVKPLEMLEKNERDLFTHDIFSISESEFPGISRFSFFHNYNLIAGTKFASVNTLSEKDCKKIKIQTALEFLLLNFITNTINIRFRILNIRGFLLSSKAIKYDLDFLGVNSGTLFDMIEELIFYRSEWFKTDFNKNKFVNFYKNFFLELERFLKFTFETHTLYTPEKKIYQFSGNIKFVPSQTLQRYSKGIVISSKIPLIPPAKLKKINKRLNNFTFLFPYSKVPKQDLLEERFLFYKKMLFKRKARYPGFSALGNQFVTRLS